jgi:PKD repeat protein
MKKILLLSPILFPGLMAYSQAFSGPESVEYDSIYNRWLVGNKNNGTVLVYSPGSGTLSPFASGVPNGPYGIEILDSVLYCCAGGSIKGYHLSTGTEVFSASLGASFLNGITSDGVSNLFVTDFTAKKIYRVNVLTGNFNVMVTGLAKSPNGIFYDGPGNRCVFVNWGTSAPIMAMNLADSTTTTLVTTTLGNLDGLTQDIAGNWYTTAWSNNALNRFAPDFSGSPVAVKTGLSSPADIDFNEAGDSVGIPNSGNANNVVFYSACMQTLLVAGFTSNVNQLSVQFTDQTTGGSPGAWSWDFGDGNTSAQASPSHVYSGPGNYEVCLIVSDDCGADTTCDTISITALAADVKMNRILTVFYEGENVFVASSIPGVISASVLDTRGRKMEEFEICNGETRQLGENFSPGLYFLYTGDFQGNFLAGRILIRGNF